MTLQVSRTNNKRVISSFKFVYPPLTLKEGPRSNLNTSEDSYPMIFCRLASHAIPVGPIMEQIFAFLKSAIHKKNVHGGHFF